MSSGGEKKPISVKRYDFRLPNKFSREQLRILKTIFENWGKAAAPQLSAVLRQGVEVGEIEAEEVIFGDHYNLLDDSVVGVIDPDRLPGAFLVSMKLASALAIYHRVLGSSKEWAGEPRDLTEIETATVEMIVANIVESEMPSAWEPITNINFSLDNFGATSNFIGVVPLTESTVVITVPFSAESFDIPLRFCLPYAGLESLVSKLNTQEYFNRRLRSIYREQTLAKRIPEITVDPIARLATLEMSFADVQNLAVGSEIALPRDYREKIDVFVDDEVIFDAQPHVSTVDGRYMFRITDINAPAIEKLLAARRARQ